MWFRCEGERSLRTIPLRFTSLAAPDPYVQIGGGGSWQRVRDLVELRQLMDGLGQEGLGEV